MPSLWCACGSGSAGARVSAWLRCAIAAAFLQAASPAGGQEGVGRPADTQRPEIAAEAGGLDQSGSVLTLRFREPLDPLRVPPPGALEDFILADEHDLYKREVMASVMAGRCDLCVPGNEVWRVGNSGWDGFVEVRRRGQSKAFWIRSEALRVSSVPASEAPVDDGLPPAYSP